MTAALAGQFTDTPLAVVRHRMLSRPKADVELMLRCMTCVARVSNVRAIGTPNAAAALVVQNQIEPGGLLDRNRGWLAALENLVDEVRRPSPKLGELTPYANKPPPSANSSEPAPGRPFAAASCPSRRMFATSI